MATFHNFAVIVETSLAKMVVKLILENRNVYVWFINSWIEKTKNYTI